MKINLEEIYFRVILLFPITTLFQSIFEPLNKIVFGITIILQIMIIAGKIKIYDFMILFTTLSIFMYNYTITTGHLYNANELFYLPFALLYLLFSKNNIYKFEKFILKDKKYIKCVLNIWTFIVFASIFMKSSWPVMWGSSVYFGSICKSIFRLGPTAVFIGILAICCMNVYNNKYFFWYLLLPLFCFLMGGSRTYLIVGLMILILGWYFYSNKKREFFMTIIPISFLLLFFIINSSIMNKIEITSYNANSYFDFWGTLTSGRSIFWKAELEAFKNSDLINKLFGSGFNFVYEINYKSFGSYIWAHNDFLQILLSHGIIMLIVYIKEIISIFKINYKRSGVIVIFLTFNIWLFNAFFNMCYTYFCALLALPFMIINLKYKNKMIK